MSAAEDAAGTVASLMAAVGEPSEEERAVSRRILEAVRNLAASAGDARKQLESDPSGSSTALHLATSAARALGPLPRTAALVTVEVASSVLGAPWIASESVCERAIAKGLSLAGRVVPHEDGDAGRDVGTWGGIAGAVAIDPYGTSERWAVVASIAASLALAPVSLASSGHDYAALRAGHGAASAVVAVLLADAGFVGDPEAVETLRERLGAAQWPEPSRYDGWLAREGLELLERVAT